jgi:hypothetical protein
MNYEKEEIFNNGITVINFYPEIGLLETLWVKLVPLDTKLYKEPFIHMMEFIQKTQCRLYLSDITMQGVVPTEDKKWFREVAFPSAVNAGIKFGAVITGNNAFKNFYLNAVIKVGKVFDLPVKVFSNYEKGVDWLVKSISK